MSITEPCIFDLTKYIASVVSYIVVFERASSVFEILNVLSVMTLTKQTQLGAVVPITTKVQSTSRIRSMYPALIFKYDGSDKLSKETFAINKV